MPPELLRLFIAIELPSPVRDTLAELQKRLQTADRERAIRWVSISGVHLTLKFLGDTSPDCQPEIEAALHEATAAHQPFDLTIEGAGCFPDTRKPRIVWAGVGGDVAALRALRESVERTVSPLGFPTEERPFSPHLTLGRARQEASREALAATGKQVAQVENSVLVSWHVDSVSLMRSDLSPSGAVYMRLAQTPLGA